MSTDKRLSESRIVREVADRACKRVARKVSADLQRMDDALLSGEDSGLRNAWDEICVQIQGEQSIFLDAYDSIVCSLLAVRLAEILDFEREAIWLQTPEGEDWSYDDDEERESYPVALDDIISYVLSSYIHSQAADWSNPRIRAYLDRDIFD